jgi:hypothetical protein
VVGAIDWLDETSIPPSVDIFPFFSVMTMVVMGHSTIAGSGWQGGTSGVVCFELVVY